jgi:hypothetical protein
MKTYWLVSVKGLGGPLADFMSREYQVDGGTAAEAIDKAISAYEIDQRDYIEGYDRKLGTKTKPFEFLSAHIVKTDRVTRVL